MLKINYVSSKRHYTKNFKRKELGFESSYTTLTTEDERVFYFLEDRIRCTDGKDYVLSPVSSLDFFTEDLVELNEVVEQKVDQLFKDLKINFNKEVDRFAVTRHAYMLYKTMGDKCNILPPGYFRKEFSSITPLEQSLAKSKMFISFIADTGMFVLNDMKANAHTTMHHSHLKDAAGFYDMLHLIIANAENLLKEIFSERDNS